jgi:peptide/nickel transport system substrate-binding protein
MLAALKAGDIDVALDLNERDLDTLQSIGGDDVRLMPSLQYEQVSFNQAERNPLTRDASPWSGDPTVLKALNLAIDRPALLSGPLHGASPPASGPISPFLGWVHDGAPSPSHDLAQAKRILDDDGWVPGSDGIRVKNGRRLQFSVSGTLDNPLRASVEDVLVSSWKQVGADVRLRNYDPVALFADYRSGGVLARGLYEAAVFAWVPQPDPDSEYNVLHSSEVPTDANKGSGQNYSRCHDAVIDTALTQGRSALDEVQRAPAYRNFQAAYANAGCELPLYQRLDIAAVSPRLHNFVLNPAPTGNTWNLDDWWLA